MIIKKIEKWALAHPVTFAIMSICIIVWLLELLFGNKFIVAGIFEPNVALYQPWRFITAMFMHDASSIFHLAFNMFALFSVGQIIEKALGSAKFAIIYGISGIAGNFAMLLWSFLFGNFACVAVPTMQGIGFAGAGCAFSLGASGAVFGLFGSLLIIFRRIGANQNQILMTLGINFLLCLSVSGIAWQAHLGGVIAGAITTILILRKKQLRLF